MPRPVGPSSGVTSRPSFVSGSADTMERQIKKRKDDVYRQTLANLAKLEQEKQDDGGGISVGGVFKTLGGAVLSPLATVTDIAAKPFELIPGVPDFQPESVGSVNLLVSGGNALKHVTGDAYQLGRSIFTGKDTLSESPSAKAYQAAGGGLLGTISAAGPYLELAGTAAPIAGSALRGAGVLAPKPTPFKPLTLDQVPATAPTTPYRQTRAALAEDMAVTQSQPFLVGDDIVRQVTPSVSRGSFVVRNSEMNTKQQVPYSVIGETVLVDAEPLYQVALAGEPAIRSVVQHLEAKYPNARIATNYPDLQKALNNHATNPVLQPSTEPVRKALTFKPVPPTANESADEFSRRLAQGDQTFDRVTFSEPYEPRGISVFVHRTLPDQAERLLVQGMEPEPRSWLGNMGGGIAGEGVFPEGTLFASEMGSPTDELFAQAMNDQFGDIRGGVPLQVTLPQNARVLEINFDLPDISPQDFTEAGLSAKQYYDFLDILESLGGNRKNETAVKGALAQLAQREAFDAVVFGEELMVIPRPRNPELMQALKRFVEWEEDDL